MEINRPQIIAYSGPSPGESAFGPPIPEPSGEIPQREHYFDDNDSGTGPTAQLPPELRGFSWGALLMNWMWAIAHNTWIGLLCIMSCVCTVIAIVLGFKGNHWIGLLCFIPYAGTAMAVVLGFKGNQWAWQNRHWESVEQFRTVQRIWRHWAIGILVPCLLFALLVLIGNLLGYSFAFTDTLIHE